MTRYTKYNKEFWDKVQKYYDEGNSIRDCIKIFHFPFWAYYEAKESGFVTTKSRSEGLKIALKKKPHLHTEETKKMMSINRKKYLKEHPEKVPYKLNHYSKKDSYPELYFKEVFEKESIDLKHHKDILCYELDFYNLDKKIYFEVDGEQHYVDKRIVESDIRRNKALFEEGWIGARIRWSTYQKLDNIQKHEIIKRLKQFIENNNRSIPIIQIV
jgi:very-short-patch-repair endonuclease